MKKREKSCLVFLCVILVILSACGNETDSSSPYKIYYLNAEQNGLVEQAYKGEVENTEQAIEEILQCLKTGTEKIEEQSVIPKGIQIEKYKLEKGRLTIYFSKEYLKLNTVHEVLLRAAVVRSLTQLDEVKLVAFYVDGEPLKNKEGKEYGYFQSDDFVQNTGASINSYEETTMKLYFANENGDKLVPQSVAVQHNSNAALEKAIVEQLMRGPSGSKTQRTIPKGTKLLSVSMKEGICYLNFDEGFHTILPGITPEVTIYSIVNSVLECGSVGQVQILINGESNVKFQESIDLENAFSKNYELIEE